MKEWEKKSKKAPHSQQNMSSSLESKALGVFIQKPVSQDMIQKLVVATLRMIQCQDDKCGKNASCGKPLPSLATFISRLVKYTNVYTGTLMATLVLLNRLKLKLPLNAQGLACTRHRVFLSCLILASKFHNDSSPKNVHWATYTDGLFSLRDVNLMERQLLFLLNWNVKVSNEEMILHLGSLLSPVKDDLIRSAKLKKFLQDQQHAAAASRLQPPAKSTLRDISSRIEVSRSSSAISSLSLTYDSPVSITDTDETLYHTRQSSCSSVESMSPLMGHKKHQKNLDVHSHIELTARIEEMKLTKIIHHLGHKSRPTKSL